MRFKTFEIRKNKGNDDKLEVIKWFGDTCIVIAFIEYKPKEPGWEIRSVGMRFIEEYEEGLAEYIKNFMNLVECVRKYSIDGQLILYVSDNFSFALTYKTIFCHWLTALLDRIHELLFVQRSFLFTSFQLYVCINYIEIVFFVCKCVWHYNIIRNLMTNREKYYEYQCCINCICCYVCCWMCHRKDFNTYNKTDCARTIATSSRNFMVGAYNFVEKI